jgi:hypothetical protein
MSEVSVVPSNTGEAKADNDGSMKISQIKCNGVTACAKLDCATRFMEPQDGYIKSESRCKFAKCTVISSQEIYNDEDIRSVYTNKAPFNGRLCLFMILGLAAFVALAIVYKTCPGGPDTTCETEEEKPPYALYGFIALLIGLIAGFFFWLQCCRPTLKVAVFTSRLGWFPFSWGTMMEELKVRGHGPGISIQDADDVGHKILNRNQAEQILSEHAGIDLPKQGMSQKLFVTNRRVGFKRRKACCCNLITLENSLWTYKLDEVANCHADASFPLFFIIWCVWLMLSGLVFYLWWTSFHPCLCDTADYLPEDGKCETKPDYCSSVADLEDSTDPGLRTTFYIFAGILALYTIVVPRLPGGVGCCRKSRIVVYFKSPSPTGCPGFLTDFDEMELPPGSGANKAVEICSEIMRAKADYIREKTV